MSAVRPFSALIALVLVCGTSLAHAEGKSPDDGVYGRFDGDLDLGLALGPEFSSQGTPSPALRGSAHYFSIVGAYVEGRAKMTDDSAPSLIGVGVDLRPLFVPRWAKGFETGPAFFDLTLDSLSLSLGGYFGALPGRPFGDQRGFEAAFGFGLPLFASARGLWLETRGILRYPDNGEREEALLVSLSYHGLVSTPWLGSD